MSKSRYFLSNSLTHNIKLRPFNPPILTRIQAFNARVKNAKGDRHVFISKNCKWLLHNIYNLKFKEGTSIVDIPTQKQIKNNRDDKFIRLQAYRYMLNKGMTVTSGCRCKQHNKDEGGVDTSLQSVKAKPQQHWISPVMICRVHIILRVFRDCLTKLYGIKARILFM